MMIIEPVRNIPLIPSAEALRFTCNLQVSSNPINFSFRGRVQVGLLAPPISPHLMTPAAVGNRDTIAAVFNGLGRIYMVTDPPTAAETGLEPPPPTGPSV